LATKILLLAQEISHPTPGRLPTEGRPEAGGIGSRPDNAGRELPVESTAFFAHGSTRSSFTKALKPKVCCIQVTFSSLALRLVDLRPAWLVNRRTAD